MRKHKLTNFVYCFVLLSLVLTVSFIFFSPVNASKYSGTSAYIFKDTSKQYTYFVNSSTAGFLWLWDSRYPGVQNLGEGGQFRAHSNYAYDLKPESMGYSVVYWEYEDGINYVRVTGTDGDATQTILRNASDFSLVKFAWSDSRMSHNLYYGFWKDKPYIWVYLERTMNRDMLAENSQTCNMLSKNFKKFWWTDYTGNVVNWNSTGTSYRYTEPMFSALDNGTMDRYPFVSAYNDVADVTVGFMYLGSTPNIRKDTHMWGFEIEPSFVEVQVDWGGETDGGRRYWRQGTTMGLEYLVFVRSGAPNKSGNIVDYSKNLYNNVASVWADADYGMWSAAHHRFRDFSASDSFPVGLSGHTLSTGTVIAWSQPRTYYVPYMDQVPLTKESSLKRGYADVPLYSKWNLRQSTGSTIELDNQLVNESKNRTTAGPDSITAMMAWDKGAVTAYSHLKAFKNSDKLLFFGNVTLDINTNVLDSSFILYFNNVQSTAKISDMEYDIRFVDPIYGWSGIYLKANTGVIQKYSNRLEIRLFNYTSPQAKPAGTSYNYNFTLWGHPGNRTSMTDFFTTQPVRYRRPYQNYASGDNAFGFESMKEYLIINSTYSANQLTTYAFGRTSGQKIVEVFVKNRGSPTSVKVDNTPISFNYDSSNKIVSFNVMFSGVKKIVITWPSPDIKPPTYSNTGHNSTMAGKPALLYSLWQDNSGLSGFIFATNNTGSWVNNTWTGLSGSPAWANVSMVLNNRGQVTVGYRWYANDTSNNWNTTSTFTLTTISDDHQSPTYSSIQVSTTAASSQSRFSSFWQDNAGLYGYIFSTNNTGIWTNDTMTLFSGLASWANVTKTLNSNVGTTIGYRWYSVDINSNWNGTGVQTLTTTYSARPQYSSISYSTTSRSEPSTFGSFWIDDQGLSGYIFGSNLTGTWMNETWSPLLGMQGWANKTETLPNLIGVRVEFQWWCNDTQNQWATTGLQHLITTVGKPPTYSDVGYNTTLAGKVALSSSYWKDSSGLSGFIFSWNGTGSWKNDTLAVLNGVAAWANVTKTLNSTIGMVIGFRWYCSDIYGNWNSTNTQTLTTTKQTQPIPFGKTTIGLSTQTVPAGYVYADRLQAPGNGMATTISAYIKGKYQSGYVKALIYSDVGGAPGTLLYQSSQITLSTQWGWHNFTIDCNLQAGNYYWFTIFASVESQYKYDAGLTNQEAVAWGWTYPNVPTNFNGIYGPFYLNDAPSIYVTYIPE